MKSVLMIASWFPPEGNAAVYRPLRSLRNLPAYGWQGRVIAGPVTPVVPGAVDIVPRLRAEFAAAGLA